ncbi:MAG TPA: serine hydrolase [Gemmatimonadaceae bacterium]|nr:serine hydrolase [Gemmatimonadaceae bacterium]
MLLTSLITSIFLLAGPKAGDESGLPSKAPSAVGMSSTRLQKIDQVIARAIRSGGFPGASVVVGRRGATVWEKGFGNLTWSGKSAVVPSRSIYDLASLTKVVGTTTAIMILYDQDRLELSDKVSKFIPEFSGGAKDDVTIHDLLEHRSGLPAGRELWRIAFSPAEARQAAIQTPLQCLPRQCLIYSDVGADMLGFVVEAVSGQRLDVFLDQQVFTPLGMTETGFRPHWTLRDRIAPTELTPPRGYPLRGEVHDENAFAMGGIAGHAGLFSTASDLAVFAQMMLNGGHINGKRIVSDSTVALFTARTAAPGTRALGWDTCGNDGSCGKYLSQRAYGHTGYTGTSMWIDPDRDLFVILLTNRVHAARARRPAKVIADIRADVADAAALAVQDFGKGMLAMPRSFRADRAVGWNRPVPSRRSRSSRSTVARSKSTKANTKASAKKTTTKVAAVKSTRPKATSSTKAAPKGSSSRSN